MITAAGCATVATVVTVATVATDMDIDVNYISDPMNIDSRGGRWRGSGVCDMDIDSYGGKWRQFA